MPGSATFSARHLVLDLKPGLFQRVGVFSRQRDLQPPNPSSIKGGGGGMLLPARVFYPGSYLPLWEKKTNTTGKSGLCAQKGASSMPIGVYV